MKTFAKILLGIAVLLICLWVGAILKITILTELYGEEFQAPSQIGIDYLTAFEEPFDYKVMSYCSDSATVYYYSDAGGEKVEFVKKNGAWFYSTTLKIWTGKGGTADDYFIFPYFKKPLF